MSRPQGVLAHELDFESDLAAPSPIRSGLLALRDNGTTAVVHRQCRTVEEAVAILDLWACRYRRRHPILVLAGHGAPGVVRTKERRARIDAFNLDDVVDALEGRGRKTWIHIGSCAALDIGVKRQRDLRSRIGCAGMSGFRTTVDHVDALAFELILLRRLSRTCLDGRGAPAVARFGRDLRDGYFARLDPVVVV